MALNLPVDGEFNWGQKLRDAVNDVDGRTTTNTSDIAGHESRLTTAETAISTNATDVTNLTTQVSGISSDVTTIQSDVVTLQGDYASTVGITDQVNLNTSNITAIDGRVTTVEDFQDLLVQSMNNGDGTWSITDSSVHDNLDGTFTVGI